MDFNELARQRYSVRKYKPLKVEEEKIKKILEAGWVAPTAKNFQPQRFLVLTDENKLEKLNKVTNYHKAPLVIIVCSDRETVWHRPYDNKDMMDVDASIATDHMMMAAQNLGLGTCWMTYFDPAVIRREFHIPSNYEPVNILLVGYSAEKDASPERHSRTRRSVDDVVINESF